MKLVLNNLIVISDQTIKIIIVSHNYCLDLFPRMKVLLKKFAIEQK